MDTEHQNVLLDLQVSIEKTITWLRIISRHSFKLRSKRERSHHWNVRCKNLLVFTVDQPRSFCIQTFRLWLLFTKSKCRNAAAQMSPVKDTRQQETTKENEGEHGRRSESTIQVEGHVEGVHRHIVEEEDASRNVGNLNREREHTVRIKSVASACRSLGRCPPVPGMVALRGYSHCLPRGLWPVLGRRPLTRCVLREQGCSSAPDGTRIAALTSCRALREHPARQTSSRPLDPKSSLEG